MQPFRGCLVSGKTEEGRENVYSVGPVNSCNAMLQGVGINV